MEKISYERRVYESVDDRGLSSAKVSKIDWKNNSGHKGLNAHFHSHFPHAREAKAILVRENNSGHRRSNKFSK